MLEKMKAEEYLRALYERLGWPDLTNFGLSDLSDDTQYTFGAFVVADDRGEVVLIRRKPIKQYPGIENYWWIPGGAQEHGEILDETVAREFQEETGLTCKVERTLLAQLAEGRPFIAVFFRGRISHGLISTEDDPDKTTAEVKAFPASTVPFNFLWTDSDKIILTREGFTQGPIDALIEQNRLRKHNQVVVGTSLRAAPHH